MATYKCRWHIKHDGKDYQPGEEIELSGKEAKPLEHALEKVPAGSGKGQGKDK